MLKNATWDWYFDRLEGVNLIEKIDLIKNCTADTYLASG